MILDQFGHPTQSDYSVGVDKAMGFDKSFLKAIPIPEPRKDVKKVLNPKKAAGTPPKVETKLHCNHCGRKRLMNIATTILGASGNVETVYFNLRKLKKALRTSIVLPDHYLAICSVCLEVTPYKLVNRTLVAEPDSILDEKVRTRIINERTSPPNREVPTEDN